MPNPSANALFHTKTLNNFLSNFVFPSDIEARHQKIGRWIEALQKGTLDEIKEVSLHGSLLPKYR